MAEWQEIETAPKDETTFLAAIAVYNNVTNRTTWEYALIFYDEGQFQFFNDADTGWYAEDYTHWMPLPDPPSSRGI